MKSYSVKEVSIFLVFTSEPLHNLHFQISKLVKGCTVRYFYWDQLRTGGEQRGGRSFVKTSSCVLKGCNTLLSAKEVAGELPESSIDFCEGGQHMVGPEYLQGLGYLRN